MKLGIIGTSKIADVFMDAVKTIDDIEVVAVASRTSKSAQDFANRYKIEHHTKDYQDFDKLDLDGVYIATPNSLHFEQAKFFLERKINVLCEKPCASNVDEVEKLIRLAIDQETILMEAIVPIYTENFSYIQESISQIAPVRRAVLSMNQYSSRYDAFKGGDIKRAFNPKYSTGSLMDIGIYPLYNAVALFGTPEGIFANTINIDDNVDGAGSLTLIYPDKEITILHSKINDQKISSEIMGEGGNITINNISNLNQVSLFTQGKSEKKNNSFDNPLIYEVQEFVELWRQNLTEPISTNYQMMLDVHTILTEARDQCGISFEADQ